MLSFYFLLHFSTLFFRLPLVFLVDYILGEPSFIVHPVVLIGKFVSFLEKKLRNLFSCSYEKESSHQSESEIEKQNRKLRERISGALLVIIVVSVAFIIPSSIFFLLLYLSSAPFFIEKTLSLSSIDFPMSIFPLIFLLLLDVFWGYQCIAARCLSDEASNVEKKLALSIEEGRAAVSRIVGRDTSVLDEEGVVKACVESVAESTTDGIFSPFFFYIIAGSPLALLYKAANTMDSMIAYKNDRYIFFGTAAAHLDDVLNFIPARIAAFFMILASVFLRLFRVENVHPVMAVKIFFRDRYKHASPNSAQTESVAAGMLGIRLGGDAVYEGKVEKKESIGDDLRKASLSDIGSTVKVMYLSTSIFVFCLSLLFLSIQYFRFCI